jgi:hypothetical protein
MAKSKTPSWIIPAALVAGAIALFAKGAGAQTLNTGNVQTATVGDRVYSVAKLGQGTYLISLVSTGGVLEVAPVNYTFDQTQQLGSIGDPQKLTQLKTDMQSFNVNFHT